VFSESGSFPQKKIWKRNWKISLLIKVPDLFTKLLTTGTDPILLVSADTAVSVWRQ
jgi:hypothetical protein